MIDLCVVNYNTGSLMDRFVANLQKTAHDQTEDYMVYIADNGSSETYSREIIENMQKREYSHFIGVQNENIGYSAACNQLATMGNGDIIGLLNADVWLNRNDIAAIQQSFDDNPDMHIMGPKQRDERGHIRHAGIVGSNTAPKHRGWNVHDPEDLLFRDVIDCVTVSGSAYFIRREVWEAMTNHPEYQKLFPGVKGAFLPTPHYYEETWCSYFARHLGYNVKYDGRISIGHSWHASSPVGGHADQYFRTSQSIFRKTCDHFGIPRD